MNLSADPGPMGCNAADLAVPFGTLDFTDVVAFLTAFLSLRMSVRHHSRDVVKTSDLARCASEC